MTTTNINTGVNSLSAAKATEIESGVMLYEFNSEAETEAAVIECIEKGVKFNTTGRRSLVIHQAAPAVADEYAVTYGGEAIATTTSEAEAHEIAKGEAEAERTIINVIRKSDNAVIAVYDFTETPAAPETETAMTTTDTTENVLETLKSEFQEYHDNAAKGGANRRRNMVLLAWDIRKMERKLNAAAMRDKVKALMLSAGYVLANGSTLKDYTNDADVLHYLDGVVWVCLQNDKLSICNA